MSKIVLIISTLLIFSSCDVTYDEKNKELQSREVNCVTVVDVYTGDTIQLLFKGNPGRADRAYKIKKDD